MKFLWHSEAALWNAHPQILALAYVVHCSCCSQIIVEGVKMCSCHLHCPQVLWHNVCGFRCSLSNPGNQNTTETSYYPILPHQRVQSWINQKNLRAVLPHSTFLFFPYSFTFLPLEIHHAWKGISCRHFIHQGGWPFWRRQQFSLYL